MSLSMAKTPSPADVAQHEWRLQGWRSGYPFPAFPAPDGCVELRKKVLEDVHLVEEAKRRTTRFPCFPVLSLPWKELVVYVLVVVLFLFIGLEMFLAPDRICRPSAEAPVSWFVVPDDIGKEQAKAGWVYCSLVLVCYTGSVATLFQFAVIGPSQAVRTCLLRHNRLTQELRANLHSAIRQSSLPNGEDTEAKVSTGACISAFERWLHTRDCVITIGTALLPTACSLASVRRKSLFCRARGG